MFAGGGVGYDDRRNAGVSVPAEKSLYINKTDDGGCQRGKHIIVDVVTSAYSGCHQAAYGIILSAR